jgi:SNF2 family DNA or RNA helicase
MNQIAFKFAKIVLMVQDPADWVYVKNITGKVDDVGPGVFEMALSTQNMQRIARQFVAEKKPQVISGQQFLDGLKVKLGHYKKARDWVHEILEKERHPVPPNGKFIPYAHQTKIIGVSDVNPFSPIFADCGLGKTGALARSIELALEHSRIRKGKVLVSAPLSILHTSWLDDVHRFTSLRAELLWTPLSNKALLGEERVHLGDHPAKPPGIITTKTKTGTLYKNSFHGSVKEKPNSLDGAGWVKHRATWKVGLDINGVEYPFGPIQGRPLSTEPTRENFIREQLARTDVDLYLINHDGVRIYEEILKEHDFEWVIVDESTKIKSPKSKVSHAHVNISWRCKRRNILSGTPNPNGFTDLWQQFYFLDRGLTLEPCLKDFLYEYFKPVRLGFVKTPGGRKEAIRYEIRGEREQEALISRVRSVGIYLEQRDCIDLPPRTDTRRLAYMTAEQEVAYDRMARDLVTELTSSSGRRVGVEAVNVLSKIMKLRQITSGFLLDKDGGDAVHLETNPKWEVLDEYIEELQGKKVVIAAQFREEIASLVRRYQHLGARAISGDVPVEERSRIIRSFQDAEECKLVVLQPAAAAHGITLTAASHLVFASLDYNFEFYYQVAKRIERIGQKNPIFVMHLLARYRDGEPTIDEDLLDVLTNKNLDRNALFQTGSSEVEEIANRITQRLIKQVEKKNGK